MANGHEGRLRLIEDLFTQRAIHSIVFQPISAELEEIGSKPCSLLLQRAIHCRHNRDWGGCREAAQKAKEYAWEQLHRYLFAVEEGSEAVNTCQHN